jgi:hypothetical protein
MRRLIFGVLLMLSATPAWAAECVVNDPTGTPLNVRARPNGPIVGALYNGVTIYVRDMRMDSAGRRWAFIVPLKAGKAGWVFREYINCR